MTTHWQGITIGDRLVPGKKSELKEIRPLELVWLEWGGSDPPALSPSRIGQLDFENDDLTYVRGLSKLA